MKDQQQRGRSINCAHSKQMKNLFILISALLTLCLGQVIAFPGIEDEKPGEQPHRLADKRMPLTVSKACPPNQLLYPGNKKHDWICDCGPGFLYYPPIDDCFKAYMQGPCELNKYLILPKDDVVAKCVENPCKKDGHVSYNGKCYELGKTGEPCKPANEGGGVFAVNVTTLQLECLKGGDSLTIFSAPPFYPMGGRYSPRHISPPIYG